MTPSVADFTNHIKYTLYKADSSADSSVTCTNNKNETPSDNLIQYYYSGECTPSNATKTEYEGTFEDGEDVTVLIENINKDTNDTYYLVVEYVNDSTQAQNDEQGKTFTVELDVAPQA